MAKTFKGISQCACPAGDVPDSLTVQECYDNIGQLYRIGIMKRAGAEPFNSTTQLITAETSWTTAIGLSGDDKLFMTPAFATGIIGGGEAVETDADANESIDGGGIPVSHNTIKITGEFLGLSVDERQALMSIFGCQSALKVVLIDVNGRAFASADTDPLMIPVVSASMGGKQSGGRNTMARSPFKIEIKVADWEYTTGYDVSAFYDII